MRLTATFTIKLSKPFFLLGPVENIHFNMMFVDFQDEINLIPIGKGHEHQRPGDKWPTYCVNTLLISVSANEDALPEKFKEDGTSNYEALTAYLDKRIEKYAGHAKFLVKKLILFFKYELRNPLLNADELDISGLYDPVWTDESEQKIEHARRYFGMERIEGFAPESRYGARPLNHVDVSKLKKCIEEEREIELYEELLSDAQAAILQKKPRRALLELAIACEVAVKQKFFMKKTPAGDVFEYFEDTKRLQVTVLELIHGAAKQTFGKSFKEACLSDYKNIDALFRCRNKIAHRGEIQYKDDSGAVQKVDETTIKRWWESTSILLNWLKEI